MGPSHKRPFERLVIIAGVSHRDEEHLRMLRRLQSQEYGRPDDMRRVQPHDRPRGWHTASRHRTVPPRRDRPFSDMTCPSHGGFLIKQEPPKQRAAATQRASSSSADGQGINTPAPAPSSWASRPNRPGKMRYCAGADGDADEVNDFEPLP